MGGERLGRIALALDVIYGLLTGGLLIVFRARVGGLLRLPGPLVAALGGAAVGWAVIVLGQTVRMDWRRGVKQVLAANVAGSIALAVVSAFHPVRGARALLAFIALDVMALAVAQGISLIRRGPGRRNG
mgnify:CR=1 FL=1